MPHGSMTPTLATDDQASNKTPNSLALYEEDSATATYLESVREGIEIAPQTERKFGTLLGVYLPCLQMMVNFLIFLRLPWIVGIAGIIQASTLVFISSLCAFLTCISVSAITTNGKLKGEHGISDVYHLLSRNIGPEFGGAIGVLFFLAKTTKAAFALVALAEILVVYILPESFRVNHGIPPEAAFANNYRLYAVLLLLTLFVICSQFHKYLNVVLPFLLIPTVLVIASVITGSATLSERLGTEICSDGDALLLLQTIPSNNESDACVNAARMLLGSCEMVNYSVHESCEQYLFKTPAQFKRAYTGVSTQVFYENSRSYYLDSHEFAQGYEGDLHLVVAQDVTTNFFVLLSIFAPTVGGMMSLTIIKDNLEKPDYAVPVGTIAAELTSFIVYFVFVLLYGSTTFGPLLRDKYGQSLGYRMVAGGLAWPTQWLVVFGATLMCIESSANELCNAPVLLQSVARDRLIPLLNPFGKTTSKGLPLNGLLLSVAMAALAIMVGSVDELAPLVLVLVFINYAFVNLACVIQTILKAPNWRPHFRMYHWSLAVLGAMLSLIIMFTTKWYYSLTVLIAFAGLYKYIEYKGAKKEWGDGLRGLALSTAQYSLLRIEDSKVHPKNWRPQLLVLLKMKPSHDLLNYKLLHFASQLKTGRGLTVIATVLEGEMGNQTDRAKMNRVLKGHQLQPMLLEILQELKQDMAEAKMKGFTEVVLSSNIHKVVGTVLQCIGIAGLRTNTVIVAWPISFKKPDIEAEDAKFFRTVIQSIHCGKCLIIVKGLEFFPEMEDQLSGNIDVWWIMHTGGLLILLPFLLRQHRVWRNCKLRVFTVVEMDEIIPEVKKNLEGCLYNLRIQATVDVLVVQIPRESMTQTRLERQKKALKMMAQLRATMNNSDETASATPQTQGETARRKSIPTALNSVLCHPSIVQSFDYDIASGPEAPEDFNSFDEEEIRNYKIRTATTLNEIMRQRSASSRLVVLNLPPPPTSEADLFDYMDLLKRLTAGLQNVVLIRGSGNEVVTMYS